LLAIAGPIAPCGWAAKLDPTQEDPNDRSALLADANGKKVTILLEELGIAVQDRAVNIGRGDQFTAESWR